MEPALGVAKNALAVVKARARIRFQNGLLRFSASAPEKARAYWASCETVGCGVELVLRLAPPSLYITVGAAHESYAGMAKNATAVVKARARIRFERG